MRIFNHLYAMLCLCSCYGVWCGVRCVPPPPSISNQLYSMVSNVTSLKSSPSHHITSSFFYRRDYLASHQHSTSWHHAGRQADR